MRAGGGEAQLTHHILGRAGPRGPRAPDSWARGFSRLCDRVDCLVSRLQDYADEQPGCSTTLRCVFLWVWWVFPHVPAFPIRRTETLHNRFVLFWIHELTSVCQIKCSLQEGFVIFAFQTHKSTCKLWGAQELGVCWFLGSWRPCPSLAQMKGVPTKAERGRVDAEEDLGRVL